MSKREATIIRRMPKQFAGPKTKGLVVFFDPPLDKVGRIGVVSYVQSGGQGLERDFVLLPWDSSGEPFGADPILVTGQADLKAGHRSHDKFMAVSAFFKNLGYTLEVVITVRVKRFIDRW